MDKGIVNVIDNALRDCDIFAQFQRLYIYVIYEQMKRKIIENHIRKLSSEVKAIFTTTADIFILETYNT